MAQGTRASGARKGSNSSTSPNATATKTRRSHRKSRNGCVQCKHRHIRCDERQPSCANCQAAERMCSFLTPQANKQNQKSVQQDRAKKQQQQRLEATGVMLPSLEVSSPSNARTVTSTDEEREEHAELPQPALSPRNNHSDLDQALDQLSHRSMPMHDSVPSTISLDVNPHQIPSPALPIQVSNVHSPPADCCPGLSIIPESVTKAVFTPQHMILLHHADKVPNCTGPNHSVVDIALRHAMESPYLLDEVLAFTAFHMTSSYPGSAVYLRHLAAELQNRALASFTQLTKMIPNDDKATAVPRFLFSAILGRHALADTLTHCRSDFDFFIDRFVECINLNRGIRAVTPPAWDYLYNSEIQPFLRVVREAEKRIVSPGNECDPLSRVVDDSDLNEASIKACRQAIGILQWSFDLCHCLSEENYPQAATVFSVRIEAGFVDVLRKHRPEALLILAYYGVLLYYCRGFWPFGDAGSSMIRAISGRLGSYWQEALAWPLRVTETNRSSESSILASTA